MRNHYKTPRRNKRMTIIDWFFISTFPFVIAGLILCPKNIEPVVNTPIPHFTEAAGERECYFATITFISSDEHGTEAEISQVPAECPEEK